MGVSSLSVYYCLMSNKIISISMRNFLCLLLVGSACGLARSSGISPLPSVLTSSCDKLHAFIDALKHDMDELGCEGAASGQMSHELCRTISKPSSEIQGVQKIKNCKCKALRTVHAQSMVQSYNRCNNNAPRLRVGRVDPVTALCVAAGTCITACAVANFWDAEALLPECIAACCLGLVCPLCEG